MRVAIAGAGAVGRSIASELLENGHEVLLIDKANLVVSLLAKTEYGVPRVVARINHPKNEWLFNESWGVDVAVSTPRLLSALVEEAVSVGDLVRLMTFRQGEANLVELTLPEDAPLAGERVGSVAW